MLLLSEKGAARVLNRANECARLGRGRIEAARRRVNALVVGDVYCYRICSAHRSTDIARSASRHATEQKQRGRQVTVASRACTVGRGRGRTAGVSVASDTSFGLRALLVRPLGRSNRRALRPPVLRALRVGWRGQRSVVGGSCRDAERCVPLAIANALLGAHLGFDRISTTTSDCRGALSAAL